MPGYTLRFHSFSSLLSTTTTHPESSPLHSSPATRDSIDSSPNMASSKVITCHSTDRASFHSEIQGPQLTPADRLDDDEASTSGTRSQELQMDVRDSALIAYSYRTMHILGTMVPTPRLSASSQQLDSYSAIDSASCVLRTMCDPDYVEHDPRPLLRRSKSSLEFCSRLCNAPPVIVDAREHRDSRHHMVLESYRRSPQNIVLDSLQPDVAPHIVITLAEDQWDIYEVMQNNRAGVQYMPHLPVPPCFGSTCRMATYEEFMSMCHPPPCQPLQPGVQYYDAQHLEYTETCCNTVAPDAQASPSICINQLKAKLQDEDWASFINDMAQILTIQARKLAAIEASLRAGTFRERHDRPGFLESIQRSFEWIDPAKFILLDRSLCSPRTSILIESDIPYTVPHILIYLAPPNDPNLLSAYPTSAQNEEFLTAPIPYGIYRYGYSFDSDNASDDGQSYPDSSDALSDTDSSGPKTPILQRVGSGFFSTPLKEIEEDITDAAHGGYKEYRISTQPANLFYMSDGDDDDDDDTPDISQSYTRPVSKFFISSYDDDDFDKESLPDMETDEWFIQARARTATIVTSGF